MYMAGHRYHNRRRRRTQTRKLERLEEKYADKEKDLNESFARAWSTKQRRFVDERRQQRASHETARRDLSEDHHWRLHDRRRAQEAEIGQLFRYPSYLMGLGYWYYPYEANLKERHQKDNYDQQARHGTEKQNLKDLHRQEIESMLLYHQEQESNLLMGHQQKMMDLWERFSLGRDRDSEGWVRPGPWRWV